MKNFGLYFVMVMCVIVLAVWAFATQDISDYGIKFDNDAPFVEIPTNLPFAEWVKNAGGLGANVYTQGATAYLAFDATGDWYIAQSNALVIDSSAGVGDENSQLSIRLYHRWAYDVTGVNSATWELVGENSTRLYDGGVDGEFNERVAKTIHYPTGSVWDNRMVQWKIEGLNYEGWTESNPTPTPFDSETSVIIIMGEEATPTPTPTETPTPTYTPTPIPYGDDYLLYAWPRGSRGGEFAANILSVTYTFGNVPNTDGVTIDGYNYRFRLGSIIRTATEMYWLRGDEWVAFGSGMAGTVADQYVTKIITQIGNGTDAEVTIEDNYVENTLRLYVYGRRWHPQTEYVESANGFTPRYAIPSGAQLIIEYIKLHVVQYLSSTDGLYLLTTNGRRLKTHGSDD